MIMGTTYWTNSKINGRVGSGVSHNIMMAAARPCLFPSIKEISLTREESHPDILERALSSVERDLVSTVRPFLSPRSPPSLRALRLIGMYGSQRMDSSVYTLVQFWFSWQTQEECLFFLPLTPPGASTKYICTQPGGRTFSKIPVCGLHHRRSQRWSLQIKVNHILSWLEDG